MKNFPDSKWAADCNRIVATREAEYLPAVRHLPDLFEDQVVESAGSDLRAKLSCACAKKSARPRIIFARLFFKTTRHR